MKPLNSLKTVVRPSYYPGGAKRRVNNNLLEIRILDSK